VTTEVHERSALAAAPVQTAVTDGAVAGVASALVFTIVHQILILDIWFALLPMLIAGAGCGMYLAWIYARMVKRTTLQTWFVYNIAHLAAMAGLAGASLIIFEPVTTMAEVIATPDPVGDLIGKAMPLTVVFVLVCTLVLGAVLARVWTDYLRLLGSVTTLTVLLGLNVSVIGLVDMSTGSLEPLVLFFALIVLLDAVYCLVYAGLQMRRRSQPPGGV
jgi:hypothetical protein